MSAHSPGPWLTANAGTRVIDTTGDPIAQVWEDPPGRANARLIAAAPDLLAALQKMVSDWQGYCEETEPSMVAARAAIAKATGAAPA